MPTIFRKPTKAQTAKRTHYTKPNTLVHQYVYNTDKWRKLRIYKLGEQPTCECNECKLSGVIKLALDVHHIQPISTAGDNIQAILQLGFDYNNLMSVNPECHHRIHAQMNEILWW